MTRRAFVYGHPVAHSISPAMHNAAFRALGLDAEYALRDVPPAALPAALDDLRAPGMLGANLTVPLKQAALPLLDAVDEQAAEIGAVNTVVQAGGRLIGHNTDAAGFLAALREEDFDPRGKRAALIGAGGAGRAIASALAEANVGEMYIVNRGRQRAIALAQELIARFGARAYWAVPLDALAALEDNLPECDLIVNATTVGLRGEGSPIPATLLRDGMLVVDIIYNPPRTRLLADATHAGARTQNGLPMLIHQAAEAFRLWTGRDAPLDVMRMAAAEALIGRPGHATDGRVQQGPAEG